MTTLRMERLRTLCIAAAMFAPAMSPLALGQAADDAKPATDAEKKAGESAKPDDNKASKPRSLFDGKSLGDWKESGFVSQGRVEVKDGAIQIGFGEGCSGVTYKGKFPTTNYELAYDAMRVDGSDFFATVTFPVKPAADHPRLAKNSKDENPAGKNAKVDEAKNEVWPCTLVVGGWGGGVVGLSSVDGSDASENSTSVYKEFESGKWYHIRLRVTERKIEAWIDKEKVIDFTIGDHKLSIRIEVEESKPLGISTWHTTGAVKNIQVVAVDRPDSPPQEE